MFEGQCRDIYTFHSQHRSQRFSPFACQDFPNNDGKGFRSTNSIYLEQYGSRSALLPVVHVHQNPECGDICKEASGSCMQPGVQALLVLFNWEIQSNAYGGT